MKSNFNSSRHIYRTDIRTFFSRIDSGIQTSFRLNGSLDIRISLCGFRNGLDVGKSRSSRSRNHYDVDLASDFFFALLFCYGWWLWLEESCWQGYSLFRVSSDILDSEKRRDSR